VLESCEIVVERLNFDSELFNFLQAVVEVEVIHNKPFFSLKQSVRLRSN
jgi:hypothetical protein